MLAANLCHMAVSGLSLMLRDRRAVTSVEYAVIALIIVLAVVGGVTSIGTEVAAPFNQVASEL